MTKQNNSDYQALPMYTSEADIEAAPNSSVETSSQITPQLLFVIAGLFAPFAWFLGSFFSAHSVIDKRWQRVNRILASVQVVCALSMLVLLFLVKQNDDGFLQVQSYPFVTTNDFGRQDQDAFIPTEQDFAQIPGFVQSYFDDAADAAYRKAYEDALEDARFEAFEDALEDARFEAYEDALEDARFEAELEQELYEDELEQEEFENEQREQEYEDKLLASLY